MFINYRKTNIIFYSQTKARFAYKLTLDKTEGQIKNEQSSDTGNIG